MRYHNHSFVRFILDTILIVILFLLILSPIILVFSLKISNLNLQAQVIQNVAGVKSLK